MGVGSQPLSARSGILPNELRSRPVALMKAKRGWRASSVLRSVERVRPECPRGWRCTARCNEKSGQSRRKWVTDS